MMRNKVTVVLTVYLIIMSILWLVVTSDESWSTISIIMMALLCITALWVVLLLFKKSNNARCHIMSTLVLIALFSPPCILGYGLSIREYHEVDESIQRELQRKVHEQMDYKNSKSDEKVIIDFGAITEFSWEKMYIIGPYSFGSEANKKIGLPLVK